jgi:diguanylate cyclase (GGDEF)-like protein
MMDIDFFKRINDEHGHLAGDDALKAVAGFLSDPCGQPCRVGRYGGEEFCVSLTDASEQHAFAWAEERRARIASASVAANSSIVRLTASFGVAERASDTESPSQMLDRADQALRAAKRLGRNRVMRYSALGDD